MDINLIFPDSIPQEECLKKEFLQGMLNRRAVSFHKYGSVYSKQFDYLRDIPLRIKKYNETGNTEWLIDVAVYAALEFMRPQHPEAHFRPTDSKESPGTYRVGEKDPSQRHEKEI